MERERRVVIRMKLLVSDGSKMPLLDPQALSLPWVFVAWTQGAARPTPPCQLLPHLAADSWR